MWDTKAMTRDEVFWSCVEKTETCWVWKRPLTKDGYGQFRYLGLNMLAHKISWIIKNGPVPENLCVLHDCPSGDNRACVNPDHLWLGTNDENMNDMVLKNRQAKGEHNGNSKLTELQIKEIRRLGSEGMNFKNLGQMFGIDQSTAADIVKFKIWKHV